MLTQCFVEVSFLFVADMSDGGVSKEPHGPQTQNGEVILILQCVCCDCAIEKRDEERKK